MRDFDDIFLIAAERKGGVDAVEALLSKPLPAQALAAIPEDRWLAQIAKSVFQAGFNWKVIDHKWDGFETAFHGFDVGRCALRVAHFHESPGDTLFQAAKVIKRHLMISSRHKTTTTTVS